MDNQKQDQPNVIVILVDDMGFADLGLMGSEIKTPNIDSLAENGVLMSAMYNCARCCPTRASLLTGLYPHNAGIGQMGADLGTPAYQGYLRDDSATIAEVLKASGYRTLMSGKWHVAGETYLNQPERWPLGKTRP
ncbi:MAG: sulfatase-like hydrolase/transferase, partial [Anaerolineae bacterium]